MHVYRYYFIAANGCSIFLFWLFHVINSDLLVIYTLTLNKCFKTIICVSNIVSCFPGKSVIILLFYDDSENSRNQNFLSNFTLYKCWYWQNSHFYKN